MGNWYKVTKRINGRLYDYWQRTHRVGKSTKTENKYIGPHGRTLWFSTVTEQRVAALSSNALFKYHRHHNTNDPGTTAALAAEINKRVAEGTLNTDGKKPVFTPTVLDAKERKEDERIQYGSLAARKERQAAAVRKAKRNAAATGALNPFLGQANTKRLAQIVANNKATNLRIVEKDGLSTTGKATGKKVYHLYGDVPNCPTPAVMEFATHDEADAVMSTALTYHEAMGTEEPKPSIRREVPEKSYVERRAEEWIVEGKNPFDVGADEIFGPNGEYR